MSLKHAILGLLTFEPMSGYTLKTRYFDKSVGYFWPADQAQIYRTLQALEADGLVTGQEVSNDTRPNQRRYSITATGRRELEDWVGSVQPMPPYRDAFLVQLYFSRLLHRDQLLRVLRERKTRHEEALRHYRDIRLPAAETADMKRQIAFGGFTLDFGRRREAMHIDWLDSVIAEVEGWDA